MDSKELRIGNFIRLKENGNIFDVQIVGTRCESIDVYNNGIYTSYFKNIDYYLDSIPLTEEWLLKFGFERVMPTENFYDNDGYAYELNYWGRIALKNGVLISDEYYFLDGLDFDIKYVHELQNLYYALTKKELTIKK